MSKEMEKLMDQLRGDVIKRFGQAQHDIIKEQNILARVYMDSKQTDRSALEKYGELSAKLNCLEDAIHTVARCIEDFISNAEKSGVSVSGTPAEVHVVQRLGDSDFAPVIDSVHGDKGGAEGRVSELKRQASARQYSIRTMAVH